MKNMYGILAAIGSAFLFGLTTPLAKPISEDFSPFLLAGLLYLGSGTGLLAVQLFGFLKKTKPKILVLPTPKSLPWLFIATLSGGVLAPLFLMWGLQKTSAANASLLLNLEAVFTALLAWIVFKEHTSLRMITGMAAILLGGIFLSCFGISLYEINKFIFLIPIACLLWGIDNNVTKKISFEHENTLVILKSLCAGSTNLLLGLFYGSSTVTTPKVLAALVIGFLGYGLSLKLFVRALSKLGTARTSAYFSLAPFFGALLSLLIYPEELSSKLIIGGFFMVLGTGLHLTEKHKHDHKHAEIEHQHDHTHDEHHGHQHSPELSTNKEVHTHSHRHEPISHEHEHYPDVHHEHVH